MKLCQYKDNAWLTGRYCIDGQSIVKIARECGVCQSVIRYYLKKYNVHLRTKSEAMLLRTSIRRGGLDVKLANDTYRNREWLEEMRINQRLTLEEIGELCNIHSTTIYFWLRRWGFEKMRVSPERVAVPMAVSVPKFMHEKINEFCRIKNIGRSALVRDLLIKEMHRRGFNPYK